MKKNAGFTLVELIVVIAILAILAGIAIPVYSGYIAKAREAADYQVLDSVKTATVFAAVDTNVNATVTKIEVEGSAAGITKVTATGTALSADGTATSADLTTAVNSYAGSPKLQYITKATWEGDTWTVNTHN